MEGFFIKIAFVYDTVYPWITGGAERRIYEISRRLVKKGHDVHIYSLGYWMDTDEYKNQQVIEYEGMTLHSLADGMDLYTEDNTRSVKEALYFAKSVLSADFKDYDIVDVQGFPYFSCYTGFLRKKNSNMVITLHEVWGDYWYVYMGKIGFVGKLVERGIMYLTDNIICVSKLTQENMLEIHEPENNIIIENGVNTSHISSIKPNSKVSDIIYAGRLIPEKNVELIIDAVAILVKENPSIQCLIVGEGPVRNDLIKKTGKLKLEDNIRFMGFCENQDDLYSLIKSSKVFILPSTREGFGIVTIEANCCGIPVITIDHKMNAAKDLINNKNGIVTENDPKCIADCIKHVLDDSPFDKGDCVEYASGFDWDEITDKTEKYYENIIKNNQKKDRLNNKL